MTNDYRIGQGIDIHPFTLGRKLILGGVEIPFEKGLAGHSDADALCHAIADALLGASALGDIGHYFPPSDMKWKDANSLKLLEEVEHIIWQAHFRIVNVDSTLILQRPQIAPYCHQMRKNIAQALKIDSDRVSIKATTSERLGFTGREEGITATAIALLRR